MFTKGFSVLGIKLTLDRKSDEEHTSLIRQGNMCIEARLKKPIQEPVTCLIYAQLLGHV